MRPWNRAKLLWGYLRHKTALNALPVEYIVETTAKCNLYCPMCPRETHKQPKEDMTEEIFSQLVRESGSSAEHMMLIGLGEPLMDRKIFDRIEYCERHNISTLLSTNGTFFDEKTCARLLDTPLEHITLSFDGATKESYEYYRKGANFEKVRDNFIRFARMKKERNAKVQVVVQMVRMQRNAGEVDDFIRFWRTIPGIDQVRIKEDETNLLQPEAGHTAQDWKHPCHYLWRGPMYVKHNGDVYPCCQSYMLDGQPLGNIGVEPLTEIWNSDEMQRMRSLHVSGRANEIDICSRCCTTIPHPLLVAGSLLLHGKTVRRALPWIERLVYRAKLPRTLLTPPKEPAKETELVQIAKLPTTENAVIHLNAADNIGIARVALSPGQQLKIAGRTLTVEDPIPAGHKVAVVSIAGGENIVRYGQMMGRARVRIEPGRHVHTHNVGFEELALAYEFPESEIALPHAPKNIPTFLGFPRDDGRVGTRNYIAVVAASNCAAHTAELIAESYSQQALPPNVDGVVAFPHGEGCGHTIGPDTQQLQRTLGGVLNHPNVAAAIILGLGCEVNQIDHYLGEGAPRTDRLLGMTVQASGGTRATLEAARKSIARMMERASAEKRVETSASKIVLGLNCGGSDSFSGITANPALGVCSDMLAAIGASAVLAETTEIFGAEHLLVRRARNRAVAEKLLGFVEGYKTYLRRFGGSFDDNPSPGNKEGGLTNILEKSLGAVAKAGTSPMTDVVDYAERINSPGFVFMNTPGYDPVSLTGLAAGGVNLIAFTTGRGSAIGFPTIPVIKIASNTAIYRRMRDNIDINAGRIADGEGTVAEVGREIFDMLLRVASGEKTSSERLGHKEFVPWRIGPVL